MVCINIPVLISEEEIRTMVSRMGMEIVKDARMQHAKEFNFVTVLEGARRFSSSLALEVAERTAGLVRVANYDVKVSSYCGTTPGELRLEKAIEEDLIDKHLIVVEDIVDSGKTLQFLANYLLHDKQAADIRIASLLSKPSRRLVEIPIAYLGREIPDIFVVGYGLDKDGQFRDLDYVGFIK